MYNNEPVGTMEKREPMKAIVETTASILCELDNILSSIMECVYGEPNQAIPTPQDLKPDSILSDMARNRNLAELVLKKATKIREGLW